VDQAALVKELNSDLATEHQSLVEYMTVVAELRRHLTQELDHALILAEQVSFLGGVPETAVPPVPPTDGAKEALEADLRLESNQLDRYRERIIQATELGLVDVAEALRPLLEQTQEHVRDLRTALGR
jgi:bacterioferritin